MNGVGTILPHAVVTNYYICHCTMEANEIEYVSMYIYTHMHTHIELVTT